MRGRPKAQLMLSEAEQEQLTALTLRRKTAQALALRARIVLACAGGMDNKAVASRQRVTPQTVSKWRARFVEQRLDGLLDAPRPGAPRTIDDARVDAVIAKTLESVPAAATHWSTRTMAREAGLSQTAVSRIWRAFGLQPHRQETFKLSSDPMFVDKVRDIVGLYMDRPLTAMVLCVDEKTPSASRKRCSSSSTAVAGRATRWSRRTTGAAPRHRRSFSTPWRRRSPSSRPAIAIVSTTRPLTCSSAIAFAASLSSPPGVRCLATACGQTGGWLPRAGHASALPACGDGLGRAVGRQEHGTLSGVRSERSSAGAFCECD